MSKEVISQLIATAKARNNTDAQWDAITRKRTQRDDACAAIMTKLLKRVSTEDGRTMLVDAMTDNTHFGEWVLRMLTLAQMERSVRILEYTTSKVPTSVVVNDHDVDSMMQQDETIEAVFAQEEVNKLERPFQSTSLPTLRRYLSVLGNQDTVIRARLGRACSVSAVWWNAVLFRISEVMVQPGPDESYEAWLRLISEEASPKMDVSAWFLQSALLCQVVAMMKSLIEAEIEERG